MKIRWSRRQASSDNEMRNENRPDEMAAGGLSEKTGDRLKRHESNPKLERTGRSASVCTRFFRKTDAALSQSFRVSYHSAAPLPAVLSSTDAILRSFVSAASSSAIDCLNKLKISGEPMRPRRSREQCL